MRLWTKQTSSWTICARKRCAAHQSLGLLACCVQVAFVHFTPGVPPPRVFRVAAQTVLTAVDCSCVASSRAAVLQML